MQENVMPVMAPSFEAALPLAGGAVSKADKAFGRLEPRSFFWNKALISKNSLF